MEEGFDGLELQVLGRVQGGGEKRRGAKRRAEKATIREGANFAALRSFAPCANFRLLLISVVAAPLLPQSLRIKSQRLWMLYRSAKRRLRQWRVRTEFALAKRERIKIARAMGKLIVKRARFLRWARLVITQRKMLRACHRFDNKFKRYGDGLGHLRYGWWRWKSRLLLQRWDDETKYVQRVEYATKWCQAKFKLNVWRAFKKEVKQRIVEKNKELDMVDRQKWLSDMMADADEELKRLKKQKEADMLQKQIALEEEVRRRIYGAP